MARTRFFDYKSPDSTRLLNEHRKGILQAGVYFGFNAVPGSSGLKISLTMETDPDITGGKLGSLITKSGVVVRETADLVDVATAPTADPILDRIDYLVATYIYNASVPANDVTYTVVAGTAGTPPTPPTLSDNQLLLAEITIPAATIVLNSSMIRDENRKNLYAKESAAMQPYIITFGNDYCEPSPLYDFPNDVIFTNAALATLTYTATNGKVQYGSAVDLSGVKPGYTLLDSSGNRWRIEVVDDPNDCLYITRGVSGLFNTTVISKWSGAVVRGNVVVKNDALVSYSYTASTGVIQYAATVDLSAVKVGYLFVDGSGNRFQISAVNPGINTVTIESYSAVSTSVIHQDAGSVETNNNPRNAKFNDLLSPVGFDEIITTGERYLRGRSDKGLKIPSLAYEHYDQRVYELCTANGRVSPVIAVVPVSSSENEYSDINNSTTLTRDGIHINAYMTGIVFCVVGQSTNPPLYVLDGALVTPASTQPLNLDMDPSLAKYGSGYISCSLLLNLPPGIHDVQILGNSYTSVTLNKVLVLNNPTYSPSYMPAPGRAWKNTDAYDYEWKSAISALTVGSRGGCVVAYIPDYNPSGGVQFAKKSLPEFSTTGDTNSNTTISNVSSTSGLRIGDLILVVGGGFTELHLIAGLSAVSITTATSVGFTQAGCTIKYRGTTFATADSTRIHDTTVESALDAEGVADYYNPAEGPTDFGFLPIKVYNNGTGAWGQDSWNFVNCIAGTDIGIGGTHGDTFRLYQGAGEKLRYGFVGSGLDVFVRNCVGGCTLIVSIDGISIGTVTPQQFTWLPICGSLNYEFHTVEFEVNAAGTDLEFEYFRIYAPAEPPVSGLVITKACRISEFIAYTASPAGDMKYRNEGVIQYAARGTIAAESSNFSFTAFGSAACSDSRCNGSLIRSSNTADYVYVWFYGTSITIVFNAATGGDTCTVKFLNKNDTFMAPSALTGLSVTGVDSFVVSAGNVQRKTWTVDEDGLHCIAFNALDGASNGMDFIGYEVHQPYYTPTRIDNPRFGGIHKVTTSFRDTRVLRALKEERIKYVKYLGQLDHNSVNTYPWVIVPFIFASSGGFYRVTLSGTLYNTALSSSPVRLTPLMTTGGSTVEGSMEIQISTGTEPSFSVSFLVSALKGLYSGMIWFEKAAITDEVEIWGAVMVEEVGRYSDEFYLNENQAPYPLGIL